EANKSEANTVEPHGISPFGGLSVITCPKCAKDNQDRYKFCLGCGAELPRENAPKPFSPQTPPHGVPAVTDETIAAVQAEAQPLPPQAPPAAMPVAPPPAYPVPSQPAAQPSQAASTPAAASV